MDCWRKELASSRVTEFIISGITASNFVEIFAKPVPFFWMSSNTLEAASALVDDWLSDF